MALFVRLSVCGSIYVYCCRALLVTGCTRLPMRITLHYATRNMSEHMQIAQLVLPTTNPWHSQGPPQLLQPGIVPCDPVNNSSGNTVAVTQAQTPTSQAAPMGKIVLAQNNSITAATEPSLVP